MLLKTRKIRKVNWCQKPKKIGELVPKNEENRWNGIQKVNWCQMEEENLLTNGRVVSKSKLRNNLRSIIM